MKHTSKHDRTRRDGTRQPNAKRRTVELKHRRAAKNAIR